MCITITYLKGFKMQLGMTTEQSQRYNWRKISTLQSGYSFVVLELLDESKMRVSGIEDLKTIPTEKKGRFHFEKVTRQLSFEVDTLRGGMVTAYVLYSPYNMSFLASHKEKNYWDIIEVIAGKSNRSLTIDVVTSEIDNLLNGIKSDVVITDSEVATSDQCDLGGVSIEELEKELANRTKTQVATPETPLTPAQKGAATRARNRAIEDAENAKKDAAKKAAATKAAMENKNEDKEGMSEEIDSVFIANSGVKQP